MQRPSAGTEWAAGAAARCPRGSFAEGTLWSRLALCQPCSAAGPLGASPLTRGRATQNAAAREGDDHHLLLA